MGAPLDDDERVEGPALVPAGLPIDIMSPPELVEDIEVDEDAEKMLPVPVEELGMESELAAPEAPADGDEDASGEAVAALHGLIDQLKENEFRMLRSGTRYRVGILGKSGKPVQFVSAMKKVASKATIQLSRRL